MIIPNKEGHLSSNGECFDIGVTTQKSLYTFKKTGNPFSGPVGVRAAGNGCLMRLAPIPLAYWKHPLKAMELAGESAKTTHGAQTAIDACKYIDTITVYVASNGYHSYLIIGIMQG